MLGCMALEASLSLLEEVGMERVGEELAKRMEQLQRGLLELPGVRLLSPTEPDRQAGIMTFSIEGIDNQTLFDRLKHDQVVCALRGGGIRLSPHFYTPQTVIEQAVAVIRNASAR